jgi:hypothetical protein
MSTELIERGHAEIGSLRMAKRGGVRLCGSLALAIVLWAPATVTFAQVSAPVISQASPPTAVDAQAPETKPMLGPEPPRLTPTEPHPASGPTSWSEKLYEWARFLAWLVLAALAGLITGLIFGRGEDGRARAVSRTAGAREGFQRHHEKFRDIYANLWRAAEDRREDRHGQILAQWREKIERLPDRALLDAWIALERQQAKVWLSVLQRWGLNRVQPRTIDVTEDTLSKFHVFPRDHSGEAVVVDPCWMYGDAILQKGRAKAANLSEAA